MFEIIPAIDIRDGACVRLLRGNFDQQTVYSNDPVEVALRWEREGATRLHVVDLDGARAGNRKNEEVVRAILQRVQIPVQLGGGIRRLNQAKVVLHEGVNRVVIGTAAVEHMADLRQWLAELTPARLVVGVDARAGRVLTRGWEQETTIGVQVFCQALVEAGVERVLFTDVNRDGTLEGPNVEAIEQLVRETNLQVIASGGVGSLEHVRALAGSGAESVIVGKALYDGRLSLADALRAAGEASGAAEPAA